ncbi:MAG: hypothetical protein UW03_C0028G0017 [Candidatus Peregrinibacteria bacterium GW2011_GWA2_43_8]|nr:MAG: hypothetical protein UW03_C0028G0017 [Candidatus Peregrinibacteria bacterium GW2011_GWA2_43_8]
MTTKYLPLPESSGSSDAYLFVDRRSAIFQNRHNASKVRVPDVQRICSSGDCCRGVSFPKTLRSRNWDSVLAGVMGSAVARACNRAFRITFLNDSDVTGEGGWFSIG